MSELVEAHERWRKSNPDCDCLHHFTVEYSRTYGKSEIVGYVCDVPEELVCERERNWRIYCGIRDNGRKKIREFRASIVNGLQVTRGDVIWQ
jgi:hypothetical protein